MLSVVGLICTTLLRLISFDIGIAGGGAIWGLTIDRLGYGVTLGTCVAITAVALVFAFIILGKRRTKKNQEINS